MHQQMHMDSLAPRKEGGDVIKQPGHAHKGCALRHSSSPAASQRNLALALACRCRNTELKPDALLSLVLLPPGFPTSPPHPHPPTWVSSWNFWLRSARFSASSSAMRAEKASDASRARPSASSKALQMQVQQPASRHYMSKWKGHMGEPCAVDTRSSQHLALADQPYRRGRLVGQTP